MKNKQKSLASTKDKYEHKIPLATEHYYEERQKRREELYWCSDVNKSNLLLLLSSILLAFIGANAPVWIETKLGFLPLGEFSFYVFKPLLAIGLLGLLYCGFTLFAEIVMKVWK